MSDAIELSPAHSGAMTAAVTCEDGATRHLHSIVDPQAESALFEDLELWGNTIVFLGVGLGHHAAGLARKLPAGRTCIIIDYYDQCLDFCKQGAFAALRKTAHFISGTTGAQAIEAALTALPDPIQIVKHPASYHCHQAFYDSLARRCRRAAVGASRPHPEANRVLLCYGTFFLEEELARAFKAEGLTVTPFPYPEIQGGIEYESRLCRLLQLDRPDFIISVNMKGFDGNGILSALAAEYSIPLLVWFVDDPHPIVANFQGQIAQLPHYAFTWEKNYIPYLRAGGFKATAYLPLASDPALFYTEQLPTPELQLGFVGSSMGGRFLASLRQKFLWQPSLETLVDAAADKLLRDPFMSIYRIVKETCSQRGSALPFTDVRNITWLCCYIIHTASMRKRRQITAALREEPLELFGDAQGWADVLGSGFRLHPDIDYRHELAAAYRRIAININITSCQMSTAVNQRVFDVPLAGSFLITDHQADLDELFAVGPEITVYGSIEELRAKIAFFKVHEAERQKIILAGRGRILREHTYRHRVRAIISAAKSWGITG
ncbi:MAG: glycosyltransferase [Chitinivibrionales bacterium]|nr:glycosyltransferase [Chitinivibrionales bacterium]